MTDSNKNLLAAIIYLIVSIFWACLIVWLYKRADKVTLKMESNGETKEGVLKEKKDEQIEAVPGERPAYTAGYFNPEDSLESPAITKISEITELSNPNKGTTKIKKPTIVMGSMVEKAISSQSESNNTLIKPKRKYRKRKKSKKSKAWQKLKGNVVAPEKAE